MGNKQLELNNLRFKSHGGDLSLETPAGIQHIELSEELEVDVDGDSKPELIVYVSDVSTGTNDRGAEVRILLKNASNAAAGETKTSEIPSVELG